MSAPTAKHERAVNVSPKPIENAHKTCFASEMFKKLTHFSRTSPTHASPQKDVLKANKKTCIAAGICNKQPQNMRHERDTRYPLV